MSETPRSTRRLLVTADDVGLHRGLTLGAVAAHERGIVTACSLVAGAADFDAAAALLREREALAAGVHLRLVDGRPCCAPEEVPTLVEPGGAFAPGYRQFVGRYIAGKVDLADVERELRRQIELVVDAGLRVRHLNSHQHVHMLPGVFRVVVKLAGEFGVRYVRLSVDRGGAPPSASRRAALAALALLGRIDRRSARRRGVAVCDGTIGIAEAGRLDAGRIAALLPHVAGLTEMVCHPGLDQRALSDALGWGYAWEQETDALCDPAVAAALRSRGIEPISPPAREA